MITTEFVVDHESAHLVVRGAGTPPDSVAVVGARARTEARVTSDGRGWVADISLAAARWGGDPLPLPSGVYELQVDGVTRPCADIPSAVHGRLRAGASGGAVVIEPPLTDDVRSPTGQAALERRYAARAEPLENAVFFESFYGRTVGCNPLAIDRELSRRAPAVRRYWSVVDLSLPVPEGAIAVVEGSPEWWRARGRARLLVVNDWLRRRFARRRGQHVLQTWHGTPLKRLALHRPGVDPRRMLAVVRESRRWDILLAQNPTAAGVLRRAYAFLGKPIWIEGYPRNDILAAPVSPRIRERLGIEPHERVLLYAPTWRDDRAELVDFIDPAALATNADAVVLVRGHSRTLAAGRDTTGPRVIDVTGYPDVADLLAIADALVTDYSSLMFDFSVTGRPMYFLVPDLEHYRGTLRGFYFDLADHAPGPVVRTQTELEAALATPSDAGSADRYAAWRRRFNARDDGRAAERVVARILDQGLVTRE